MNLLNYVNIDIGTGSEYRESFGNTLPNVQYPFGNQAYVLQTNKQKGGWFYQPQSNYIEGIRVSNQPSPWLGDYGHITLLPFIGNLDIDMHSSISEVVKFPHLLQGKLNRYKTSFKLVPTKVGAKIGVNNNSGLTSKLSIDCHSGMTEYRIDKNHLYIINRNLSSGEWKKNYRKFYCLKFNCDIVDSKSYSKMNRIDIKKGNDLTIELHLDNSEYMIDLTTSYISDAQAKETCDKQGHKKFEDTLSITAKIWNDFLNTILLDSTVDENTKTIFYSNLYRVFCYPRFISEVCADGHEWFYCFKDGTVKKGSMITDIGFWDVYRSSFPLIELLLPGIYQKVLNSILNYYEAYGWLPRWLAPYERGIMPSTLVDSIVSKAIINNKLPPTAINSVIKNATVFESDELVGRTNLEEYLKYGFIPYDTCNESVSMSLDNYYSDYCISKALEKLKDERYLEYKQRADNYKKLFSPEYKAFIAKDSNFKFKDEVNIYEWGTDFCESSAVQNRFNVVHDIEGVIELYGGVVSVIEQLDKTFDSTIEYDVGKYGFEIHEITEYARINNLGHFAISNQPSFIMPFWYLKVGQEEAFYRIIDKTLEYFKNSEYGYPGDEDNGSLAAWYIWVNIGMYPFCPVDSLVKFNPQVNYILKPIKE